MPARARVIERSFYLKTAGPLPARLALLSSSDPRWNLNIHYHHVFTRAVPPDSSTALDVGCGDGLLSFDLAERGLDVLGIDPHEASVDRAMADSRATEHTRFVCGDVLTPVSYTHLTLPTTPYV